MFCFVYFTECRVDKQIGRMSLAIPTAYPDKQDQPDKLQQVQRELVHLSMMNMLFIRHHVMVLDLAFMAGERDASIR